MSGSEYWPPSRLWNPTTTGDLLGSALVAVEVAVDDPVVAAVVPGVVVTAPVVGVAALLDGAPVVADAGVLDAGADELAAGAVVVGAAVVEALFVLLPHAARISIPAAIMPPAALDVFMVSPLSPSAGRYDV